VDLLPARHASSVLRRRRIAVNEIASVWNGPAMPGPPHHYDRQGRSEASVARRLPHQARHRHQALLVTSRPELATGGKPPLRRWNREFEIPSQGEVFNGVNHKVSLLPNPPPICCRQNQNRYSPVFEVLLVAQILIGGDDSFKASRFGSQKEIAVLKRIPATFERGRDLVIGQGVTKRCRCTLIE